MYLYQNLQTYRELLQTCNNYLPLHICGNVFTLVYLKIMFKLNLRNVINTLGKSCMLSLQDAHYKTEAYGDNRL